MYYRGNGFPKRKSEYWLGVIGICIMLLACVFAAWGNKHADELHDGNDIVHAHYYFDFEVPVALGDERKSLYSWHEHKDVIKDWACDIR